MTSFESAFYKEQNEDGSFTSERRQRLRNKGWSEEKINNTEEIVMRHTRIDRENALARKKHYEYCNELSRQRKIKRIEQEKLGIEPTFEILYSSEDKVDINTMSPSRRQAFEISGLDTEELLSQGYIDFDDLDDFNQAAKRNFGELFDADEPASEIPF